MTGGFIGLGSIREVFGETWSPARLSDEIAARASILAAIGVEPGSKALIAHSNSSRFFADLFAIWHRGATACCLDSSLSATELANIVEFVRPATLLVDAERMVCDGPIEAVRLADLVGSGGGALPACARDLDAPALILFTSGTTGVPKGVCLSYRAILARIAMNALVIGKDALARTLVTLPTHFGHGLIGNSLTALMSGCDIVLHPPGLSLSNNLGALVDDQRITFMSSVPALWQMALRASRPPKGNSLKRIHVGSAPLSATLWSDIVAWSQAEVFNCYGITETANWIAGASSRDGIVEGFVGTAWGGAVAVLDSDGGIRASGEGEIVVQSPSLMTGYLDRPDLTSEAFLSGWYRTGDSGSVGEDGRIRLSGRLKEEINRAGVKIQPAEIDNLLERHPAVAEACVFGVPDSVSGETVAAAIRLEEGSEASIDGLREWCRARLRDIAVPERWFIVQEIPRNARGKVSRVAVRKALLETASETARADAEPRGQPAGRSGVSPLLPNPEQVLRAVEGAWVEALGRQGLVANESWNESWDEAGGDSIRAMHLWFLIEDALGAELPLELFDEGYTACALADRLSDWLRAADGGTEASELPVVFFLTPHSGDGPPCARFRAALKDRVRFIVPKYPDLLEMIKPDAGFDTLIDSVVRQIEAAGQTDSYRLVGYSYGGFVALEAARRLFRLGHQVAFVGLIDTQFIRPPEPAAQPGWTLRSWLRPYKLADALADLAIAAVARRRQLGVLHKMHGVSGLLPAKAAFDFRLRVVTQLRSVALDQWQLKPLTLPVALFRTEEYAENRPDHGWQDICSELTVVPIAGTHLTPFAPQHLDTLCAAFLTAIGQPEEGLTAETKPTRWSKSQSRSRSRRRLKEAARTESSVSAHREVLDFSPPAQYDA